MQSSVHKAVAILLLIGWAPLWLHASPRRQAPSTPPAFIKVRLDGPVKFSHLKSGETVQGTVLQEVYSGYRLMIPRGSRIVLVVTGFKRERREHSSLWPWPIPRFLTKYQQAPRFRFANVTLANQTKMRLPVLKVYAIGSTHVTAKKGKRARAEALAKEALLHHPPKGTARAGRLPGLKLELVVRGMDSEAAGARAATAKDEVSGRKIKTISAGSNAELALMDALSASKTRAGHVFKALLVQPMRLNSGELLPEGTVFEGTVTQSVPPRRPSRSGSLHITFNRLDLPGDETLPVAAHLSGIDVSRKNRIQMKAEGGMRGGSAGKAHLLLELGLGGGIAKEADDAYQLITQAFVSTATDASTAGTARLVGFAFTGLYWLTRRGRDVILPRYTTVTVRFDRAPSLPTAKLLPLQATTR